MWLTVTTYGLTSIEPGGAQLWAALETVQKELDTITRSDPAVPRFKVSWSRSIKDQEIRNWGRRNFVVYLLRMSAGIANGITLVKKHVPGAVTDLQSAGAIRNRLIQQFNQEGGAAIVHGGRSVAFVAVEVFERRGPFSGDRREQLVHAGKEMAKLILHEAGHCMGAPHDTIGLMRQVVPVTTTADQYNPMHFSANSRGVIRNHLRALMP